MASKLGNPQKISGSAVKHVIICLLIMSLLFKIIFFQFKLNLAYVELNSLFISEKRIFSSSPEKIEITLLKHINSRRRLDLSLMWFRLEEYERAANILPTILGDDIEILLRIKGSQPSIPLVFNLYSPIHRNSIDWLKIVSDRPSSEYSILDGVKAEQVEDWDLALDYYRQALIVAPKIYHVSFYKHYYEALYRSGNSTDRKVAELILDYLSGDLDLNLGYVKINDNLPKSDFNRYFTDSLVQAGCWRLVEVVFDEAALERGPITPFSLIWECISDFESSPNCNSKRRFFFTKYVSNKSYT